MIKSLTPYHPLQLGQRVFPLFPVHQVTRATVQAQFIGFPGLFARMQASDDAAAAAAAADTVATQNLIANIASILQGTTAAVPPGPPPNGAPLGAPAPQGGPGGSPTQNRTNSNGGSNQAGAPGVGLSPGLILLPANLPFNLQLNGPGLQGLAPYLSLLPGLGPGGLGAGDGSVPYALPPLGLDGQLNLAALLAGGGLDLDGQGADFSGLDPTRKAGGIVGSKRPADGSSGAPYKRERSEEGRAREVSGKATIVLEHTCLP